MVGDHVERGKVLEDHLTFIHTGEMDGGKGGGETRIELHKHTNARADEQVS